MTIRAYVLLAAALAYATPASAVLIYNDTEVPSGTTAVANATLTNVADPSLDDGPGDTAGELSDLTAKFSNVNSGTLPLPAAAVGNPFTISVDFEVPADTNLNAGDLIYVQVNINRANRGSAGFINAGGIIGAGVQNITLNSLNFPGGDPTNGPNIPPGATDIQAQFIIADNGFGAGNDFPGGLALYVDNFSIDVVPEPASMALVLFGGLAAVVRRRV